MKNILFYSVTLLFGANLLAQNVGIGTNTPNASAKLDVVDANRGVLIPRVGLTSTIVTSPVTNPANSLLVFNTNTTGDVTPGYYYWDSDLNRWVRLLTTQSNDWKLDGNNNGVLRTIGTNDNFDFPIITNGTEKMRITAGGNVGIGTTAPGAKLDVAGRVALSGLESPGYGGASAGVAIIGTPNSGGGLLFRPAGLNSASGEVLFRSGASYFSGNVGIGTTAPSHKLSVSMANNAVASWASTIVKDGIAVGYGTDATATYLFNQGGSGIHGINAYDYAAAQYIPLYVGWGGNNVYIAKDGGNVGIGTTTPGAKLDVAGRVALSGLESPGYGGASAGVAILGTPNSGGGLLFRPAGLDSNSGEVLFRSGASYFSGDVGIGTTTPTEKLHVQDGSILINQTPSSPVDAPFLKFNGAPFHNMLGLRYYNPDNPTNKYVWWVPRDNSLMSIEGGTTDGQGGTSYFRITETGNVGIGTTAPSQKLEVCGDAKVVGQIIANSSNLTAGVSCSSDIRYKKDITPLTNALNNVMQLRGVNYFWKTKEFPEKQFPDTKQIGFIAQELEKVYPEVVFTDKDGYKSVDYSRLTPILVEAIKDQQKIIQQLQEENFKIKQANLQLQEENNQMKAEMKLLNEKVDNLINSLSNDKKLVTTE